MNVRHLDHINMTVGDFDETVECYGRVFDFELVEEDVSDGVRWGVIRAGEALLWSRGGGYQSGSLTRIPDALSS